LRTTPADFKQRREKRKITEKKPPLGVRHGNYRGKLTEVEEPPRQIDREQTYKQRSCVLWPHVGQKGAKRDSRQKRELAKKRDRKGKKIRVLGHGHYRNIPDV